MENSTTTTPNSAPIVRQALTVREVCDALGVGQTHVYKLFQTGQLPRIKLGRCTRVPAEAVARLARGE